MKTKKIYIIRHGQTEYNLQNIVQGRGINASLNEKGRSQEKAFYDYYKKEGFDLLYTSTLKRTSESVASFIDTGLSHIKLSGLDEISWGVLEGTKITKEFSLKNLIKKWKNGETSLLIDNGESPDQVALRQKKVIEMLKNAKESKILICMHGRALRIFITQLLAIPIENMEQFEHSNLCLYVFEFKNGKFELLVRNNTKHLYNK